MQQEGGLSVACWTGTEWHRHGRLWRWNGLPLAKRDVGGRAAIFVVFLFRSRPFAQENKGYDRADDCALVRDEAFDARTGLQAREASHY